MNKNYQIGLGTIVFLFGLSFEAIAQREYKPANAPRKDNHRNVMDEFGQKQGTWKAYNYFGELISEVDYLNGKRNGLSKRFYAYSKVMEEVEYLSGKKDGKYTKYFMNGQIMQEGTYDSGKKIGIWTKYFDDGSTQSKGGYKNGLLDGQWTVNDRKGNVVKMTSYRMGVDLELEKARLEKLKKEQEAKAAKQAGENKGGKAPAPVTPSKPK